MGAALSQIASLIVALICAEHSLWISLSLIIRVNRSPPISRLADSSKGCFATDVPLGYALRLLLLLAASLRVSLVLVLHALLHLLLLLLLPRLVLGELVGAVSVEDLDRTLGGQEVLLGVRQVLLDDRVGGLQDERLPVSESVSESVSAVSE